MTLDTKITLCQELLTDGTRGDDNDPLPAVVQALQEWNTKLDGYIKRATAFPPTLQLQAETLDVALASKDRLQMTLEQCSSVTSTNATNTSDTESAQSIPIPSGEESSML